MGNTLSHGSADFVDSRYLNVVEQEVILSDLHRVTSRLPTRNKLFSEQGPALSGLTQAIFGFTAWRAGFRGYGLSRYGKARILSMFPCIIGAGQTMLIQERAGQLKLYEPFRRENEFYYGLKYAQNQLIGSLLTVVLVLPTCFIYGVKIGALPVHEALHKHGTRQAAIRLLFQRVRPYRKSMGKAVIASTLISFAIGYGAYLDTRRHLALIGRKTVSLKEN